MGDAKRRGTYEQRKEEAIKKRAGVKKENERIKREQPHIMTNAQRNKIQLLLSSMLAETIILKK